MDDLAEFFPNAAITRAEIAESKIELGGMRPRELFISDIHGEYEAFSYILRTGSGALQAAIDQALPSLSGKERDQLCVLIAYPEEKISLETTRSKDADAWLAQTLKSVVAVLSQIYATKTIFEFREALDEEYALLIEGLLHAADLEQTIGRIVESQCANNVICSIAQTIQRLIVGRCHIVGDVYDRGPAPELIMNELMNHHSVDIQWGNHDIVWMGAALGQRGCIAHVVRNCARYGNMSILTDSYGMDLSTLEEFASCVYADDPCVAFGLKVNPGLSEEELDLNIKIQKAMAILQFKVEAAHIDDNPSFGLEDRKLLHRIDTDAWTIEIDGVTYDIADRVFPTVDFEGNPYALTDDEERVMQSLVDAFTQCELLQDHIGFLIEYGSLYSIVNNHLIYHACVPLNDDGTLKEVELFGTTYRGKSLFDAVDEYIRAAFSDDDPVICKRGMDLLWYLWLGSGSPLFAKSKMATFEIYLIADKAARVEVKNAYYKLLEDEDVLKGIFREFGMDPDCSRIVCGHVPVKVKDGEDPVKCKGKAVIIDGGMSSAYQKTTGIAGMSLVSDERGVRLATHTPIESIAKTIDTGKGVESTIRVIEEASKPITLAQTDAGHMLSQLVGALTELAEQYDQA